MYSCFLCLERKSSKVIEYFKLDSEDSGLEIINVVNKHFGLQLKNDQQKKQEICRDCWDIIKSFNNLYEFVLATQKIFKEVKNNDNNHGEHDPLPLADEEVFSSEPTENVFNNNPIANAEEENYLFCPEVKIEAHELDQLPKIEIIENTLAVDEKCNKVRSSHRIKQLKRCRNDDADEKTNENPNDVEVIDSSDKKSNVAVVIKKKRGRPRKEKEKFPETNPETCILSPKASESIAVKEQSDGDDGNNEVEDVTDLYDDNECSADDGVDSESSSETSSSDSDFKESSQERYAIIPKRVVVRPKKYNKRPKPSTTPIRMAREEIERRKAQQEEYDKILQKFFNNKFACPLCDLYVHNFTDMVRHHRITHKIDQGYMTCCGRKFKQRKTLAEHALVHWNPEQFKCGICEKVFQNSRFREIHEQTHSNPEQSKDKVLFQCDKCPKTFASKSTFEYHNLSKHVPKSEFKFPCTHCNKKLLTERKLKNHIKSAHDPENAIICDKCGKQMRTKHSLKKHQEIMHSDAPRPTPVIMQCQICGTWLKDIRGLKQHMKSIHVESAGEHRCSICGKVSPNARALRRHIYHNHECERKFKCTMCEKAFKRPQELREHTSTHTGEVLYTCPNCPMTFFCSANMYKHRQRLHRAQYEADKNQPRPPNILQQAVGATAAMKMKLMQSCSSSTMPHEDDKLL